MGNLRNAPRKPFSMTRGKFMRAKHCFLTDKTTVRANDRMINLSNNKEIEQSIYSPIKENTPSQGVFMKTQLRVGW